MSHHWNSWRRSWLPVIWQKHSCTLEPNAISVQVSCWQMAAQLELRHQGRERERDESFQRWKHGSPDTQRPSEGATWQQHISCDAHGDGLKYRTCTPNCRSHRSIRLERQPLLCLCQHNPDKFRKQVKWGWLANSSEGWTTHLKNMVKLDVWN